MTQEETGSQTNILRWLC